MEFYEVLKNRHSVRKFLDNDVENSKLSNILQAMLTAPSAGNLQSYKLYIVRTKEVREALVPAADYQEFIGTAPILFVFCADPRRSETKYGQRGFELFAAQDATIAASYCQLAATAEGLSSVWVGDFDSLEVSRVLSVLSFEVPVAILALGYEMGTVVPPKRRPVSELIREI
jgi:nitroreductase